MSLLITIFLLVFIAQLVTWVGKTVLLDIVGVHYVFSTIAAKCDMTDWRNNVNTSYYFGALVLQPIILLIISLSFVVL